MAEMNLAGLAQFLGRPSQQGLSALGSDRLSPQDEYLAYQKMLAQQAMTGIPTIDPGLTWGGMDKNAMQPNDVSQSRQPYARLPERI